jgi:hypothetical protein
MLKIAIENSTGPAERPTVEQLRNEILADSDNDLLHYFVFCIRGALLILALASGIFTPKRLDAPVYCGPFLAVLAHERFIKIIEPRITIVMVFRTVILA